MTSERWKDSARGYKEGIVRSLSNLGLPASQATHKIKMPGKSNKFDYTNRPNAGPKLGHIIGAALQKEAEKVRRDAERKVRKLSSDGGAGGQEFSTHVIDLKAPGKELGDDGVCAMADGMEAALRSRDLALEDLSLPGNGLTTVSLQRLARIIAMSRYDLKTVNLSGNNIRVENDEQAEEWKSFLHAFWGCHKLRRLDLSDNTGLGNKAMEIFARMHAREPQIDPRPPGGETSVLSLPESDSGDDESQFEPAEVESHDAMLDATFIKRRCGLRSLPYITLHNVGLDDTGALWLSCILENHYYPSQLISELNATTAESVIRAYQQDTHGRGVDWTANKLIGKEGVLLLEKTEAFRQHKLLDDASTLADMDVENVDDSDSMRAASYHRRSSSVDKKHPRAPAGSRRVSIRSIRTTDGGEHEASELESARKKIQRRIIGHDGVASVDLWYSAIEVFRTSRLVLFISPTARRYYTGEPLFPTEVPATPTVQPPTPVDSPVHDNNRKMSLDTKQGKSPPTASKATYAATLTSNPKGGPSTVLTDATNTPLTPLRLQKPTHRKGAFSDNDNLTTLTSKLSTLAARDASPLRFVRYQQARIAKKSNFKRTFRDRSVPSHLPKDVFEEILRYFLSDRQLDLFSAEQKAAAIGRGQRRETLMVEREWLRKDQSAQVLMLLDGIGCLSYGG